MIDHERAQELSAGALDFALSSEDREALQRHLDDCPACRALDERLRADARAVADLDAYDPPEGLRARILGVAGTPQAIEAAEEEAPRASRPEGASRWPSLIPPRYRRSAGVLAAAAVVVALVGGTMFWRGTPTAGPDTAAASPSASAPSGSGTPGSSPEPGSPLDAEIWTPVADLTADEAHGGVVALTSGFRLASLDGTPAAELAARLRVEPPVTFVVAADADGRAARLTPSEPLVAGAVYRFTLTAADGRTLDTWAFQAHQPLRIVETLPGDTATDVPTNTGIEITFDQDGVVDPASHVSISPKVDGRFEGHGRVLAFVPGRPLQPATIYTVTVTRGIEVRGTGEVLESDVRFAFETAGPSVARVKTTFQFTDSVFESATADRPTIALWAFQDWDEDDPEPAPPASAPVEIHRFPDLDGAIHAYRGLRSYAGWSRYATADAIPTQDLPRVAAFDARLHDEEGTLWFQLPASLPAGWYVVTLPSGTRAAQTILQVTDIAAYLVVSDTRTLVWANDLASGQPVVGATVATGGVELGRTDADGLRIETTPAALLAAQDEPCTNGCFAVVTVRSGDRAAFLPADERRGSFEGDYGWDSWAGGAGERYWHAFDTDRTLYRRTDTVNVWGTVRDRDTGVVPESVTIRLYADGDSAGGRGPAIAISESQPNAAGAFSGSIALDDLPEGGYTVELRAGADVVDSNWIQVDRILKPAYRLEVTTGRRVYVQGDQVKVTATATFYEGSPVPGVPLRLEGVVKKTFTTNATGTATHRFKVRFDAGSADIDDGQADVQTVYVNPARAEEGEISGMSREIVVFPSMWTFDATAQIASGRVRVTGALHAVDRDRLEREIAAGESVWGLDAAGSPIAGTTVTATFIESIPHRVKTGTRYDFIEKQVVPVYDVGYTDRDAGTVRVKTGKDGTFSASIPGSAAGHPFAVRLSATDPDKHVARWTGGAFEPGGLEENLEPTLAVTADASPDAGNFGVGEPIDLTMTDPGIPGHRTDRYLFTSARQGLRDAVVQASPRYRATFEASAPPGIVIRGIRFTGSGYTESPEFFAAFRQSDREISVGLTTNAARYDPGAEVTMTVTTRDRSGDPMAATVVLRAVDQKLFAIGGAAAADPLGELYRALGSGIVATYRSHHEPSGRDGGDTGGGGGDEGGGREDFRDWALFREVDTGAGGRAVVTFRLPDDLTSWRISGSAFAAGPMAGEGSIGIPVGLPFFVDATIASEYLVSDRPSIGLRTFGTALPAGAPVTFAVASDSLGLHVAGLKAKAFETATVALPKLTVGSHRITITASTGSGASARRDVMTRTLSVLPSRLMRTRTDYKELTASGRPEGGGVGLVDVVVSDAGAARFVPLLLGLAGVESGRLERSLAAAISRTLATDRFDLADSVPPAEFDGDTYQTDDGGLAILPFASDNLEASALAALVAPQRFDVDRLAEYLSGIADNAKETRERRNVALAGLGGLHAAVLPRIRGAAAETEVTIRERLWLGLGAAALGDSGTARSIGAALEDQYGEVTTEHARLRAGDSAADITAGTALMAMLAAANGDPLAPRFWAYVEADPGAEAPYELHAAGYVTRMLERAAPGAATFAYTIGGTREVVEIPTGETFRMAVTAAQLASLTIEPVRGRIGVTTSWREAVKPSAFAKDPDITISRRVTPSGRIGTAALVTVDLTVRLGAKAPKGCHLVTDHVPSGLVPVGHLAGWVDPNGDEPAPSDVEFPYAQIGQRVSFCADKATNKGVVHLRYVARVVTAGTYTWEPAIVESRTASGRAALTPATVVTIR